MLSEKPLPSPPSISSGDSEFSSEDLRDQRLKNEQYASELRNDGERSNVFVDCKEACPLMVVIPQGTFNMGSPFSEAARDQNEGPQHLVSIGYDFALSKYEITFEQWLTCAADGGCKSNQSPDDGGWGRGRRPVINVSWKDAQEYTRWLSAKTGENYRLPSEAEWEYAARSGSETPYFWGRENKSVSANCVNCQSKAQNKTKEVGSYIGNGFGIFDTAGNVWELVQDCWNRNYDRAPVDGSAWVKGDCNRRVIRGGSWYTSTDFIRSAARSSDLSGYKNSNVGFRVARDIRHNPAAIR